MDETDPASWVGVCRSWNDASGVGGYCKGLQPGERCLNPKHTYIHACIRCGRVGHPQQRCTLDDEELPRPSERQIRGPPGGMKGR